MRKLIIGLIALTITASCQREAEIASYNLAKSADSFEINRRIVFYNGITGDYMLTIEGLCAIEVDRAKSKLNVTCKTGAVQFKKHFLGLSDNVTYFAEQIESSKVSTYHYEVKFRPSTIIPDIKVD